MFSLVLTFSNMVNIYEKRHTNLVIIGTCLVKGCVNDRFNGIKRVQYPFTLV